MIKIVFLLATIFILHSAPSLSKSSASTGGALLFSLDCLPLFLIHMASLFTCSNLFPLATPQRLTNLPTRHLNANKDFTPNLMVYYL